MAGGAFDAAQYDMGGNVPPASDPLDLGEEMAAPEVDPEVADAAVVAFPDLEGQPERIAALVDLISLVGAGGG
jgi:hypothetical protein